MQEKDADKQGHRHWLASMVSTSRVPNSSAYEEWLHFPPLGTMEFT